ncbi:MAG: hypothetical protein JETT_2297 [Candidatus Jettenia ecosi]|uniref:Uncharacterized protein n=1 Tax=Candidatus Jettenia ecosi TaxID=2494326 RepID=A0A533QLK0_9BACT|nr:MAG: hypothetical protein JETT_2297 [Candidatus Jettenia ecosi]
MVTFEAVFHEYLCGKAFLFSGISVRKFYGGCNVCCYCIGLVFRIVLVWYFRKRD